MLAAPPPIVETAIVGATVIDPAAGRDLDDAVLLVAKDRIVAVGRRANTQVPRDARVIDARGRFLIPGLIDGYGALRRAAYADAYLYEGVTTVVVPRAACWRWHARAPSER
jgi:predicted amidohydrolase YtcJ